MQFKSIIQLKSRQAARPSDGLHSKWPSSKTVPWIITTTQLNLIIETDLEFYNNAWKFFTKIWVDRKNSNLPQVRLDDSSQNPKTSSLSHALRKSGRASSKLMFHTRHLLALQFSMKNSPSTGPAPIHGRDKCFPSLGHAWSSGELGMNVVKRWCHLPKLKGADWFEEIYVRSPRLFESISTRRLKCKVGVSDGVDSRKRWKKSIWGNDSKLEADVAVQDLILFRCFKLWQWRMMGRQSQGIK